MPERRYSCFFLRAFVKMFQNAPFQAKINNQKLLPRQVRFSSSKYNKTRLRPGLCLVPHWGGELAALPRLFAGFQRGRSEKRRRGRREREGDGRGGERSPTSFLQFNHCLWRFGKTRRWRRANRSHTGFAAPRRLKLPLRNPLWTAFQESVGGLGCHCLPTLATVD